MAKTIKIADFTRYPGPRYEADGPFSGQEFRNTILIPALRDAIADNEVISVLLDDVAGYGSSFLEEAFGGLVRAGFDARELNTHLRIVAQGDRFQHHAQTARRYMTEAASLVAA
jgi:hypothetical protein